MLPVMCKLSGGGRPVGVYVYGWNNFRGSVQSGEEEVTMCTSLLLSMERDGGTCN